MEEITEIGDGIYQLQVEKQGLSGVYTVFLIKAEQGILIDPGPASILPSIERGMKTIDLKHLKYIIPTHIHIDHGGGTGSLARLFPEARVILHEQGKKHMTDPARLIASTKMVFGDDFESFLGPIVPVPESRVVIPADGEEIMINGRKLNIIHAPGHAPHHIAIYDQKTDGLFCGEALGRRLRSAPLSPLPNAAPPGFDMEVYLATINKLKALSPKMLFYAHGGGVGNDPEALISNIAENTKIYADAMLAIIENTETDALTEIENFVVNRFGVDEKDVDEKMGLGGFRVYYKKMGLISPR
ncbi:MBL fold metallo-hydrolase [Thermodesulfobacteriota bacterium]